MIEDEVEHALGEEDELGELAEVLPVPVGPALGVDQLDAAAGVVDAQGRVPGKQLPEAFERLRRVDGRERRRGRSRALRGDVQQSLSDSPALREAVPDPVPQPHAGLVGLAGVLALGRGPAPGGGEVLRPPVEALGAGLVVVQGVQDQRGRLEPGGGAGVRLGGGRAEGRGGYEVPGQVVDEDGVELGFHDHGRAPDMAEDHGLHRGAGDDVVAGRALRAADAQAQDAAGIAQRDHEAGRDLELARSAVLLERRGQAPGFAGAVEVRGVPAQAVLDGQGLGDAAAGEIGERLGGVEELVRGPGGEGRGLLDP